MKHINKFLIFLLTAVILTGCFQLDRAPYGEPSSLTFWKTEAQCKQGIMGIYQAMRYTGTDKNGSQHTMHSFGRQYLLDLNSDIAFSDGGYPELMEGTYTSRSGVVSGRWSVCYSAIQRANTAIRNISVAEIDETAKTQMIGEAQFMRALFYFYLYQYYGGVPIYDETFNLDVDYGNMMKLRASEEDLLAFVEKDLNAAVTALPIAWDQLNYGRATKGAAHALLGKMYLHSGRFAKSVTSFEEVIKPEYGYALGTNFANLFKPADDSGTEMIFAIQNIGGVGIDNGMAFGLYVGTRSTFGSGWNSTTPSTDLGDMYETKDGKPFDWETYENVSSVKPFAGWDMKDSKGKYLKKEEVLYSVWDVNGQKVVTYAAGRQDLFEMYENRDPRMAMTMILPYDSILGWQNNAPKMMELAWGRFTNDKGVTAMANPNEKFGYIRNNTGTDWQQYMWRKFCPEGDMNGELNNRLHVPINFALIRLADVYLMLAEAYNKSGNQTKAVKFINKVRDRVGVKMPLINDPAKPWMAATTKEEVFDRIFYERARELAGEGHREIDLRRWKKSVDLLNGKKELSLAGVQLNTRRFEEKSYLWPIPGAEIDINSSLTQNPGW